ncbi:hypothetical protein ACFFTM_03525 [Pseudoduganella plicata]|uniref:IS1 family transposase n=1 Tax=Pseudoduganella plicata TaxID=321984 RepID=A0ABX5S9F6_9BURK|nr:hypothetical protein E1742_12955 [Pseudoduganella plicata]
MYRHGVCYGLQRYRCRQCRRSFNALTNTPLAFIRLREKWLPFLRCMLDSMTVRVAADAIGIHRNTSFRYCAASPAGARQTGQAVKPAGYAHTGRHVCRAVLETLGWYCRTDEIALRG